MDHNFNPIKASLLAQSPSLLTQIYDLITIMASIPTTPLKLCASEVTSNLLIKSKGLLNTYCPCYYIKRSLCSINQCQPLPSY